MANEVADASLRKLSRRDLLELLVEMSEENDRLKARVAELEDRLASKELCVKEAGSLAQVAAEVSELLLAAQETADLYLHNLSHTQTQEADVGESAHEDGAAGEGAPSNGADANEPTHEDGPTPATSAALGNNADGKSAHHARHMAGDDAS